MKSNKYSKNIIILDGGMGRELMTRGESIEEPLWSARPLIYNPDAVFRIHKDFLLSGAEIITANTFGLKPLVFKKMEMLNKLEELYELAVYLAKKAVSESDNENAKVAVSIPPLTDSYRYDQVLEDDDLKEGYKFLLEIALKHNPDIVLAETLTTVREAEAILKNTKKLSVPLWISFSVGADGDLRSGEKISYIYGRLKNESLQALLFNCSAPDEITKSIKKLIFLEPKFAFGGYANLFHEITFSYSQDKDGKNDLRRDILPFNYSRYVDEWINFGATILGGCCGVGPDYIAEITNMLK